MMTQKQGTAKDIKRIKGLLDHHCPQFNIFVHSAQCTCIVKINTPKIGKILKVEINLSVLKLMYLGQFVSDLSKLSLKIYVRSFFY